MARTLEAGDHSSVDQQTLSSLSLCEEASIRRVLTGLLNHLKQTKEEDMGGISICDYVLKYLEERFPGQIQILLDSEENRIKIQISNKYAANGVPVTYSLSTTQK